MSWFTDLFAGSAGVLVDKVGGVIDNLNLSGEEKQQFKLELEKLAQQRDADLQATLRAELQAKERVLVAELSQGDKFTKRARPSVVYAGLAFMAFNYCVIPAILLISGKSVAALDLPPEFWYGWTGIVCTWAIGRTAEKRGSNGKLTSLITGTPKSKLLGE